MSEVMLHGVLNMPADLWDTTSPFDSMQRQSRYFEASKLIYSQADKIAELEEKLWKTQQESEQAVTRAAEMIEKLEAVLNKLIDRAIPEEAWSVFPDGWLDEAVEALKEGK
jgi:NAD-specific glutamate dehydrogenase